MELITYAVLLCLIQTTLAIKDCVLNNITPEMAWEKQLQKDLKRSHEHNYDPLKPPSVNKSAPFSVHVTFIIKNFQFDSNEEVFSLYTWMFMRWTDDRLKWDPKSYGDVKETEMTSLDIWVPIFRLSNTADEEDYDRFFYTHCTVNYNGKVLCVPRTTHKTTCSVMLKNWPYDRQKCSVIYGTWTDNNNCVNLTFSDRAVSMIGAEYGAEWVIVDYEQFEGDTYDEQLEMVFTVEREAVTLAALIIYPSYIIIFLTLATLFLDVRENVRLHLVCYSLFCHCFFVSELGENIPKHSIDTPIIILYYRASEILTAIDFLLTVYLRIWCVKKSRPVNFVISINDYMFKGYGRIMVYPRWDIDDKQQMLEDEENFIEERTKFANILNSICIIVFVIVYICLYCLFMPQPYPIIY